MDGVQRSHHAPLRLRGLALRAVEHPKGGVSMLSYAHKRGPKLQLRPYNLQLATL